MQETLDKGKVSIGRVLSRMASMMKIPLVHNVVRINSNVYQSFNFLTTEYFKK